MALTVAVSSLDRHVIRPGDRLLPGIGPGKPLPAAPGGARARGRAPAAPAPPAIPRLPLGHGCHLLARAEALRRSAAPVGRTPRGRPPSGGAGDGIAPLEVLVGTFRAVDPGR